MSPSKTNCLLEERPVAAMPAIRVKAASLRSLRWLGSASLWAPVIILIVAGTARYRYLRHSPLPPVVYDAVHYYEHGAAIGAGHWSPRHMRSIQGPGYPLFLGILFTFFPTDPWTVRYAQAVLSALTCLCIYSLGKRLAGRTAGFIAGMLAALYPPLILLTGRVLTETLAIFLFWLGLGLLAFALVRVRRTWLILSGGILALAALSRPTMLPVVPFLIGAVYLAASLVKSPAASAATSETIPSRRPRLWRRLIAALTATEKRRRTTSFACSLLGLLGTWSVIDGIFHPIVGVGGFRYMVRVIPIAINPYVAGWAPDLPKRPLRSLPSGDPNMMGYTEWAAPFPIHPVMYSAASLANLVFYHFWFPENAWRENVLVKPDQLPWIHRAILILGLAGAGIALTRWRRFALLLLLLPGCALALLKWIEARHVVPYMPVFFIFAGLFVTTTFGWLGETWSNRSSSVRLVFGSVSIVFVAGALIWAMDPLHLAILIPTATPARLGTLTMLATIGLGFAGASAVYILGKDFVGRSAAAVAGFVPAAFFAIMFGSASYIAPEPGWRAWRLDLGDLNGSITHEVRLPEAIPIDQIEFAQWLVDLSSDRDPPPLVAVLTNDAEDGPPLQRWIQHADDSTYQLFAGFSHRPLSIDPQWWCVSFDPKLLDGKKVFRLKLARPKTACTDEKSFAVTIGGVFAMEPPCPPAGKSTIESHDGIRTFAPIIRREFGTSLYKWLLTDDWRLWGEQVLSSRSIASSLPDLAERNAKLLALSEYLDRHEAYFNIRLVIHMKDGTDRVY
jgi:4-amino-4-deoxy-L-arabinose transferase-like glycosyltransferase